VPLIEWNDTFTVNIHQIDEQHKKLFQIINTLYDAMKEGKGEDVLYPVLQELEKYVHYHFHAEESWMKMHAYPDFSKHKAEHEEAAHKVNMFLVNYERGEKTLPLDVLTFLSGWLQNHILQTDRKYIPYLAGKI
jgi:hemerythrin